MDELELSGRRHISTRRAGKEHGYHSDYIGQLIRGKKVAGQKVGRSWYVDEASLNEYLGKETKPAQRAQQAQPAEELIAVEEAVIEEAKVEIKKEEPVAVEEIIIAEEKVEIKKEIPVEVAEPIVVEEKEEEEQSVPISIPAVVTRIGGLTYVADEEPLLPVVRTRSTDEAESVEFASAHASVVAAPVRRRRSRVHVAAALVGILVLVGVASAASIFVSSVVVVQGETASVGYSLWTN